MSFNYVKYRDESVKGIVTLVCDTEEDIASLPTNPQLVAPGSKTTVIQSGNTYILNSKNQWTLFKNGEGGGAFRVNYTVTDNGDDTYSATTTTLFSDISSAMSAGKDIVAIATGGIYAVLSNVISFDTSSVVVFCATIEQDGTEMIVNITHESNGTITFDFTQKQT